ncbi:MAG TPA: ParB/RepB/Spo0J family partition protein [Thermoanaerobaculia bacterium]|nr:ParB/RepB/Spo0J family partition protein [Thermoanaerobaculia bacterium]
MRHDSHFVDALSSRFGASLGRWISLDEIETNPDQPRTNVGDLRDLARSIEAKGVLEPLLVRPIGDGRYRIIAGERRFRAAMEAGLTEVPCIEFDVPENEVIEIALIENLHRKDLHPFEEAEGYAGLANRHGYTQQQIADAVGKSRVSVTEAMSLLDIPEDVREECRRADIGARSVLLQIGRLKDPALMREAVHQVTAGSTREDLRTAKKESADSKHPRRFAFVYKPKGGSFKLNLSFQKSRVEKSELIETLRQIIKQLEAGDIKLPKK